MLNPRQSLDKDSMFYVIEEGNDFTFLLDAAENSNLINKLLHKLSGTGEPEDQGSFAGQIDFRNLVKAQVENIEEDFWNHGNEQNKAVNYLCERISKTDRDLVNQFKENRLNDDEKTRFTNKVNELLAGSEFNDLAEQDWIDRKEFPPDSVLFAVCESKNENPEAYRHLLLEFYFPHFKWKSNRGRALICRSHAGEYLSVTVRKQKKEAEYEAKAYQSLSKRAEYLFSPAEYCEQIYEAVFQKGKPTQGLLVVTGSTNSLKSEIARGVIHLYLRNKSRGTKERPHHLVTFEDPIEKFYYENLGKKGMRSVALPKIQDRIDYTPREGSRDAPTLRRALHDALRQTPTVFYVGETRNRKDWQVLLDFAATGHLIVTTAHAGSLVEAMHKIFEACDVRTAGDRAEIARRLFGLIHLRSHQVTHGIGNTPEDKKAGVLLPAVWKHTDRGIAALISNGLASVLPDQNETASCLGRRWFIDRLITRAKTREVINIEKFFEEAKNTPGANENMQSEIRRIAREWDLEGV